MKEVLLSGCTASEYSYDALTGGTYLGAMTCYALTNAQLHSRLRYLLDNAGYPQHPQLEGSTANRKKQIFT